MYVSAGVRGMATLLPVLEPYVRNSSWKPYAPQGVKGPDDDDDDDDDEPCVQPITF
jgi:hypothetical protein